MEATGYCPGTMGGDHQFEDDECTACGLARGVFNELDAGEASTTEGGEIDPNEGESQTKAPDGDAEATKGATNEVEEPAEYVEAAETKAEGEKVAAAEVVEAKAKGEKVAAAEDVEAKAEGEAVAAAEDVEAKGAEDPAAEPSPAT